MAEEENSTPSFDDEYRYDADVDEDGFARNEADHVGVRLKDGVDVNSLQQGVEFNLDETSLPKTAAESRNSYFEHGDAYKTSEMYNIGSDESDADDNDDLGMLSFDSLRAKMKPITEDGGIVKRILRPGMGSSVEETLAQLVAKENQKPEGERRQVEDSDIQLAYHYSASKEGDKEPFDVSFLRDSRPQKSMFNDEFFIGFKMSLATMKEKEIAEFLIGPEYAFGKLGCPPRIPSNATLKYRIELVKILACTELDIYTKMSRESKKLVSVEKLVKLCSKQRESANKLFQNGDFRGANYHYGKALRILEEANLKDDSDEKLQQKGLLKLYLNKSMCAIKLKRWDHAITFSNKALEIEPKNAKALYRKGKAKMEFGDFTQARKIAQLAHSEYPNDAGIGRLLSDIDSNEAREKKREKLLCQKMFNLSTEPKQNKPSYSKDLIDKCTANIKDFQESDLKEIKLTSSLYTCKELDALADTASKMNLTVLPNKEKDEWISLRLRKQ